jgi:hypothetical protein
MHLGFSGECKRCRSGLIESTKHCMNLCSHSRKVWRWTYNIREALGLTKQMSWKELISGIKPGNRHGTGYQPHQDPPLAAWDIFKVALMWRIWFAKCRTVFARDSCSIFEVFQLAWKDTIFASMARLRHLRTTSQSSTEKKQLNIASKFRDTWYRNQVLCTGSFNSSIWCLTPAQNFLPSSLTGQPGPQWRPHTLLHSF